MTEPHVTTDHPDIQAHLAAQAEVPDTHVKLADGRIVPVGGDNSQNGN